MRANLYIFNLLCVFKQKLVSNNKSLAKINEIKNFYLFYQTFIKKIQIKY